jgi:hypothetical protein
MKGNTMSEIHPPKPSFATIIALPEVWKIDLDAMRVILNRNFPTWGGDEGLTEDPLFKGTLPTETGSEARVINFQDYAFIITSHVAPLPIDQLVYGPPNPLWPNAPKDLAGHKAHVRVILHSKPKDRKNMLAGLSKLKILTVAICESAKAIGVLWCPSDNCMPAAEFTAFYKWAADTGETININARLVFVNTPQGLAVATHGMNFLIGREIEFTPTPQAICSYEDLYNRILYIAQYLYVGGTNYPKAFENGELVAMPPLMGSRPPRQPRNGWLAPPVPEKYRVELADRGLIAQEPIYRIVTTPVE